MGIEGECGCATCSDCCIELLINNGCWSCFCCCWRIAAAWGLRRGICAAARLPFELLAVAGDIELDNCGDNETNCTVAGIFWLTAAIKPPVCGSCLIVLPPDTGARIVTLGLTSIEIEAGVTAFGLLRLVAILTPLLSGLFCIDNCKAAAAAAAAFFARATCAYKRFQIISTKLL